MCFFNHLYISHSIQQTNKNEKSIYSLCEKFLFKKIIIINSIHIIYIFRKTYYKNFSIYKRKKII